MRSPIEALQTIIDACGSQVSVAQQAGYTKATISAIARGKRGITPGMALILERIGRSNGVEVSAEELCPAYDWAFVRGSAERVA